MSVVNRETIMDYINKMVGDNASDEVLSQLEDIKDTLDDYDTRMSDEADWKQKYESNDKEWREKYKARFFSKGSDELDNNEPVFNGDGDKPESTLATKYEDLFKESEVK